MADGNWIKLNRKIWDNFIWSFEKPKYALAWIDILLLANYKDKKIMFDGRIEVIPRGSFITSMVKLADRWEVNRETVKRYLDLLQNEGMITYTSSNRRTLINVVNYEVFQRVDDEDPATEPAADPTAEPTPDPATEPAADPAQHKKIKEGQEGKKVKKSSTVSKETVCSTDVQRIVEAWNALGLSKVKKIVPGTNRDTLLRARLKDYGVDDVLEAIENIKKSTFLRGGGEKGWVITFDWLIKPNKFPKVLGGDYTDNPNPPAQPSSPRRGRTEMVPGWMKKQPDYNPTSERIKKNGEMLDKFLAEQEAKEKQAEIDARVEALKERISGGSQLNKKEETI